MYQNTFSLADYASLWSRTNSPGHFLFIFLSPLFTVKNRIEDVHGGFKVLFLVKIIYDDVSVNTFVWMPLAKRMNKSHSHKAKAYR